MRRQSELHDALSSGDQARVITLLHSGADIEEHNSQDWTPLMAASFRGQVGLARLLLDHGADLHAVNAENKSALHYAAMRGGPEAVRLLVRLGADVSTVDTYGGYAPLHLAAAHCNRQSVQDTCAVLLAAGADVNVRTKWGTTPLFSAAVRGAGDLVDFLLRHGAEVDTRDTQGRTTLIFVAKMGFFYDMVRQLITHGADVNAQDDKGCTALMHVALYARHKLMDILIDSGADVHAQDVCGRNALMYAAGEAPSDSEVGVLGREANTRDVGQNTAAWNPEKKAARLARAYQRRADAVRHLMSRGADSAQRDGVGKTALDVALENAGVVGDDNAEVVAALSD